MVTLNELRNRAIEAYEAGDVERAERLKEEYKNKEEFETLRTQAIDAFEAGDVELAESLKSQAKQKIQPYKESQFTDVGRGITAAPVTLAQGITEFGTAGFDAAFGTNYSRPVTEAFENFKREYNLNPTTTAGNVTEELVGFGLGFIPIIGWLGRANKVAQGSKIVTAPAKSKFFRSAEKFGGSKVGKSMLKNRTRLIGTTALATGGFEAVFSPDGRATISDSFDILPDPLDAALETERTENLSGADLGLARLRNSLRRGVEGGLASLTFDVGLPVVGAAARAAGTLPGVSPVTSSLARASATVFNAGGELISRIPGAKTSKETFDAWFKPGGVANGELIEEVLDVKAVGDTAQREALKLYKDFEKATGQFMSVVKLPKKRKKTREQIKQKLYKFLTTGDDTALDGLNDQAKKAANRMLKLDLEYQDKILLELEQRLASGTGNPKMIADAIKDIEAHKKSVGGYIRRRYAMYDDAENYYKGLVIGTPEYNAALKEMKNYVRFQKPGNEEYADLFGGRDLPDFVSDADLDEFAERKLLRYLDLDVSDGKLTPQQALREKQKALAAEGSQVVLPGRAVSITDNMFIKRVEELKQLPSTRELMGEVVDPAKAYFKTISDMSTTLAGLNFYRNAANTFGQNIENALENLAKGERPLIVRSAYDRPEAISGEQIVRDEDYLRSLGYEQLEAADQPTIFFGPYADLTRMFVTPEVKQALTTPARLGLDELGQAVAVGALLKGQAQRMTIVPNLISQIRNITGNGIALAQNGNLARNSDFVDTFRLIAANTDTLDDEGLKKLSRELGALGVMDTSLVTSALRDFRDMAKDFKVAGKLQSFADDASYKLIPFMQQLENLYSNSDSYFKLMAVFAEQGKMANALSKAGIDINNVKNPGQFEVLKKSLREQKIAKRDASLSLDTSPANFLLTMAGDTVKDTMPVYSRVGKAIRRLDAIPVFGNFTSFASENIRNAANTLSRGVRELSFKADDQLIRALGPDNARILERQIRGIGSQRLMSYLTMSTVMPAAITKASMLATGTTEQELEAAKALTADFYDGHALGVISNDGRGKMELFDQSYVFPHAFVTDPVRKALQTYNERGELGKDEADQILTGAWSLVQGYADPFLSESLFFERVRDVLPQAWIGRDGETQTGAKVYSGSDSFGDKMSKSITHIMGTYIPGYGRMFVEERGGKLQPGRLFRGLTGEVGTRGQDFTANEELARTITGFTPIPVNVRTDFRFKGGEYLPLRSAAKSNANREIKRADATVPEMVEAWNTYLDNLYREQSKLFFNVQAARAIGASDQEIRSELKLAGMGGAEISAILRGEFWPGLASKELIKDTKKDMRSEDKSRVVNQIPWSTFNRLSNDRRNMKLEPVIAKEEREARLQSRQAQREVESQTAQQQVTTPSEIELSPQQPPVQTSVQVPQANVNVQPTVTRNNPQSMLPFLGSNPFDALRNLELLQRLRGTNPPPQ
tara:strand:- start:1064 stop:5461 length:4398 start_codon:yes stop_codon:yes gene_type:complete